MAKTKIKKTSKKTKTSKKVAPIKKAKVSKKVKTNEAKKSKETAQKNIKSAKTSQKFYDQLKLNESYVSLFLGAVVVVAIFSAFFVYVYQSRNEVKEQRVLNSVITPSPEPERDAYTMQEGETLWDVAVRFYGDGFAYTKIVEANKDIIKDPNYVPPGTVIILPGVSR